MDALEDDGRERSPTTGMNVLLGPDFGDKYFR